MTKVIQRSPWIKPVVTFDEADLDRAMRELWARIAARGGEADGIVGIATGGLICAQRLESSLTLPVFSCAMRRPGTATKRNRAIQAVLRAMPYGISNWLRRIEDRQLAAQTRKPAAEDRAPSAQLLADVAAIAREVSARGLRHLVVIDDAADSGATLACVVGALRAALPAETAITTAVISQTRRTAKFYPDVALHFETLCRFPWSLDFHRL